MKKFRVPIYGAEVRIYRDNSKALAAIDKSATDDLVLKYVAFCGKNESYFYSYVLYLPEDVPDDIVVHECVHLCNFILNDFGVLLDPDNDEPMAYLIQYLFNEVKKRL